MDSTFPFVSVVTPTYNRCKFIKSLVECYKSQTYPKDRMEWIIFDDGPDSCESLVKEYTSNLPNIRYIRSEEKLTIGAKRNRLNAEGKGEIFVAMDDDDFYCPERVAHAVIMMRKKPSIELAGASEVYIYYTQTKEIIRLGPYGASHATNGTLAYRKNYAKTHTYDETVTHAEEKSFLDDYKNPMIQLNSIKVMLVMCHKENTFNKEEFRIQALDKNNTSPYIKLTQMKLKDWIRDKSLRDFFSDC